MLLPPSLLPAPSPPRFSPRASATTRSCSTGQYYITQLRYDGINAIAADEVTNDVFRATVVSPNGQQVFEFFDRDSLQQIKH